MTLGRYSQWWGVPLVALGLGCSIAPKSFKGLNNPAPITRARAMGQAGRDMHGYSFYHTVLAEVGDA